MSSWKKWRRMYRSRLVRTAKELWRCNTLSEEIVGEEILGGLEGRQALIISKGLLLLVQMHEAFGTSPSIASRWGLQLDKEVW